MAALERMSDFFAARVDGYDEHMLKEVEGCAEGYALMASLVPASTKKLLDLGCGTGLELDFLFPLLPDLAVTGVDLTPEMLNALQRKHADKNLTLICGDYFKVDFGKEIFDCAVSFETMHHFPREPKTALYRRICDALLPGGCYIECDYMVDTQEEEDHWFAENDRLRRESGITDDSYCHYDTPHSIANLISMMHEAGFASAELVFRLGGTGMLVARKSC